MSKKKVIFTKPKDLVGIGELNPRGYFMCKKNGDRAILTDKGVWLSLDDMKEIPHLTGSNKEEAIIKANNNMADVYQYDAFYELCRDYLGENG